MCGPPSLIGEYDCLRKANKSVLCNRIGVVQVDPSTPDVVTVDMQHMLYHTVLNDSMIILDHGNICVDTNLMIIIMDNFSDIDEIRFFDNGGPRLHTHLCIFIRQHFLTMKTYV